ncbi:hypothetical protein SDC9_94751 [bioreactor metagenome]|uniref:Uncharacterized protein n=1 Tax=bioreactor metagenome TaxID=1076179 RepID=A0A645A4B2_9ZZZZ
MEEIYLKAVIFRKICRKFNVHRIIVHPGQQSQYILHQRRKISILKQFFKIKNIRRSSVRITKLAEPVCCLDIQTGEQFFFCLDILGEKLFQILAYKSIFRKGKNIGNVLGIFFLVFKIDGRYPHRIVQAYYFGVIAHRSVHSPCAESKYQAQHARGHINVFVPDIEVR